MKYYYGKTPFGFQRNSYLFTELPLGKTIYGFMYYFENGYDIIDFKPVKGMILKLDAKEVGLDEIGLDAGIKVIRFVPFKKGTNKFDFAKSKHFNSVMYASTYKEATEMYNEMISNEIIKLQNKITLMKNDYLKSNKYKKKRKKKKERNYNGKKTS